METPSDPVRKKIDTFLAEPPHMQTECMIALVDTYTYLGEYYIRNILGLVQQAYAEYGQAHLITEICTDTVTICLILDNQPMAINIWSALASEISQLKERLVILMKSTNKYRAALSGALAFTGLNEIYIQRIVTRVKLVYMKLNHVTLSFWKDVCNDAAKICQHIYENELTTQAYDYIMGEVEKIEERILKERKVMQNAV